MTIDNYYDNVWEFDHITPLSYAKTIDDAWKLAHYKNIQPLTPKENKEKRDKL